MSRIQLDTRNGFAPTFGRYLLKIFMPSQYLSGGQRLLQGWDYRQGPKSAAAAYYNAVWRNTLALTFHDDLRESVWPDGGGRWFEVMRTLLEEPNNPWWDDVTTDGVIETRDDILAEAMAEARDELVRRQARRAVDWTWGHQHRLDLENQTLGQSDSPLVRSLFNRGGYQVGGGGEIVDATEWDASVEGDDGDRGAVDADGGLAGEPRRVPLGQPDRGVGARLRLALRGPDRPVGGRPDAGLAVLAQAGPGRRPQHADHAVGEGGMDEESRIQVETLEKNVADFGVPYFGINDARRGIVHVIGPEQGLTLPGMTIVCGDSHTSTHGAFGALAFGIGTSEVEHVLATQTLIQRPAKNMRVSVEGSLPLGVTAKDMILAIIGKLGTAGGTGYVIEYAGRAIREMTMEGRMTVCNMSIEAGARAGLIAPDETTFSISKAGPTRPRAAPGTWRSASGAVCRATRARTSTRGSISSPPTSRRWSPGAPARRTSLPITDVVPDPANAPDENRREAWARSLAYMGLTPGTQPGRRADRPCVHRLVHQRPHRGPARGRRDRARPQGRAERVGAMVVPGSGLVKAEAEEEGLDKIFIEAGFEWREPGLLDVPGDERRPARARPALRLDLEPQLRRPPRPRRAHPPGEPGDGGRRRHPGTLADVRDS